MFSATWPEEVRQLAADFHSNPVFLNVGSLELAANHNIEQIVEVMDEMQKPERLAKLLSGMLKEVRFYSIQGFYS
jgi:superfamily II DNA/RNA helicase